MKRYLSLSAVMVVAACCAAFQSADKAQNPEPKMALLVIEQVDPAGVMEYEKIVGEMVKLLAENNVDPEKVHFNTISGTEMGYVYVIPLENGFASMPTAHANFQEATASISEWKELDAKANKFVTSRAMFQSLWRSDLSYTPQDPRLKEDEIEHIGYTFIYVKPGQEEHFEELAAEFGSLYSRNNIRQPWNVYESITGNDLPLYVIAFPAKSELDLAETRSQIHETLGEEGAKLGAKAMSFARRFEQKDGTVRRDLSYPATHTDSD